MNYLKKLSEDIVSMDAEAIGYYLWSETGLTIETVKHVEQTKERLLLADLFSECIGEVAMNHPVDRARMKRDIDNYLLSTN